MGLRIPIVTRGVDGREYCDAVTVPESGETNGPLVSCLMVTRGERPTLAHAIACYRAQSWRNRELVIVSAEAAPLIAPLLADLYDPTIRFVRAAPAPLGTLRNVAAAAARGALLCVWDDDDLSHPRRIEWQHAALVQAGAAASFILGWTIWWPWRRRIAIGLPRFWEASMLVRADALPPYPPLDLGEDHALVEALRAARVLTALDWPTGYAYVAHGRNSCGVPHFDRLWATATARFEFGDYERALAELAAAGLPVAAYAATLERESGAQSGR